MPVEKKTDESSLTNPIHLAINETMSLKPNRIQTYTLDEILLLELPPTAYSIELNSAYDKHNLMNFAKQNALGENAIYYTVRRDHKIWHVLLYSYFNTKAEAQAALEKFSPHMLNLHPKIQSAVEIQQKIKVGK